MEEVAAAIDAVAGDLVAAQDQAGGRVPRVGRAGHVPPGVDRVAGVDADRVAVDAARAACPADFPARVPAGVAEDELVRGQRDRLADARRVDPLGQRRGGGVGGLLGRRLEDRLAHPVDPVVVRRPRARRLAEQVVLVEQPGQEDARLVGLGACASSRARS